MPAPRKVFRIEQLAMAGAPARTPAPVPAADETPLQQQEAMLAELRMLRDLIEARFGTRPDDSPSEADGAQAAIKGLRQLKDETDTIHRAIDTAPGVDMGAQIFDFKQSHFL